MSPGLACMNEFPRRSGTGTLIEVPWVYTGQRLMRVASPFWNKILFSEISE